MMLKKILSIVLLASLFFVFVSNPAFALNNNLSHNSKHNSDIKLKFPSCKVKPFDHNDFPKRQFIWGPIALSTVYPGVKGSIEKVFPRDISVNLKDDAIKITRVEPNKNLQPGVESIMIVEVECNLRSMKKAILALCFNTGGSHGETSQNAMEVAIWEVHKGFGKYILKIPVVPKAWPDGTPFAVLAKLRKDTGENIVSTSRINLDLMNEIIDLSTVFPGLRGTVQKLDGPVENVDTNRNDVFISYVNPNINLEEGVETNIIVDVEYSLTSQAGAILGVTFNDSSSQPEADMERVIWEVSKGTGKYRFTIPVIPKRWYDGTLFRVGTQLHNFSDPDPMKHNAPLCDSHKIFLNLK